MKLHRNNTDISFSMDGVRIHIQRIVMEVIDEPIPSHCHGESCFELHYITDGTGYVITDGKRYELESGTFYVTGPFVDHEQVSYSGNTMIEYCVYLKAFQEEGVAVSNNFSGCGRKFIQTPFWFQEKAFGVGKLIEEAFIETQNRESGYQMMVEAKFRELIILLSRFYINSFPKANMTKKQIPDNASIILDDYFLYHYKTATLEDLSMQLSLSTRQTERMIRQYYGKTFRQKRTDARMSMALILLKGRMSVTETAYELGFSSAEHFSNAFKKHYGKSPLRYIREGEMNGSESEI